MPDAINFTVAVALIGAGCLLSGVALAGIGLGVVASVGRTLREWKR
jgi:hypothetical protein